MEQATQVLLQFEGKKRIADTTYSFYFNTQGVDFNFLPGQYIRMTLPIIPTDGLGKSRFFTIASSPFEKNHIAITTQRGKSDFKNALYLLQPGEYVTFFGPLGGFYLQENITNEHVFLAGGIGITPFYSMISYAVKKSLPQSFTLFASFSKPEDILFYSELSSMAHGYPNIQLRFLVSNPKESSILWTGETGRITRDTLTHTIPDILKPTYYIVGPPEMVTDTEELLQDMGAAPMQVRAEHFTGY